MGGCHDCNHLHFGVADKLDETPGFVTFPIAFTNYEVREANGNRRRVLRGIPKAGEVIRAAPNPDPSLRYNAVWRPSTQQEIQVHGWRYQDYRAAYDNLWPQGWRLYKLDVYQP